MEGSVNKLRKLNLSVAGSLSEVRVVTLTVKAINYENRGKSTKVDFEGTGLMPQADGIASVSSDKGRTFIDSHFDHLRSARDLGPEYLTYVMWAITPQGRPVNLGEIVPDKHGKVSLKATTDLQNFGMLVTAEPFFAVTRPSNMVVLHNLPRPGTRGTIVPIDAKFEAFQRGDYTVSVSPAELPATTASKKTPLELLEARNAVVIARVSGAEHYAPDAYSRAQTDLSRAEIEFDAHHHGNGVSMARAATQAAEDARLLSIQRREQEQVALRQQEQEKRVEHAREQASQAQQEAEQAQLQTEQAELQKQQAVTTAQAATEEAARERTAADEAKQQALEQQQTLAAQAQQAEQQAQSAQQRAESAEQARENMRRQLMSQLNQVMQTRDTARGLIINMNDVLFATGKATLRPEAKIRLAKVAGIIEAYPDLHLNIEGYTDDTGSPNYNQTLSEQRAAAVRDFLIAQGVSANNAMAEGFGPQNPIASNSTPEGRQMNRRVDLVVSGPEISQNIYGGPSGGAVENDTAITGRTSTAPSTTLPGDSQGATPATTMPEIGH